MGSQEAESSAARDSLTSQPPSPTPLEIKDRIKQQAYSLGFSLAGVTSPDPPPHTDFFQLWLAAGYHGEMGYLANERSRERRADPRAILPGCRSILVLATNYYQGSAAASAPPTADSSQPPAASNQRPATGAFARYAWGSDYHDVLSKRLEALVAFVEAEAGRPVEHKIYVDTGPVLERDLAQRAGLGWIGKNTNLINPRLGSWLLLSEILLALPLEPDPPFLPDHCGSCTRCIDACPTGCILPDRTLDSNRCISYLTIELKGPIPEDLRPHLGDWVFGCDVCQTVCPWNRFAPSTGDPTFLPDSDGPRGNLPAPDLTKEIRLSDEDFREKFRRHPAKRAKRRGYLRNVAVALGNSRDAKALPALREALHSEPDPLVREHIAWAIWEVEGGA